MSERSKLLAIPQWSGQYTAINLSNNNIPEIYLDDDGILESSSGAI